MRRSRKEYRALVGAIRDDLVRVSELVEGSEGIDMRDLRKAVLHTLENFKRKEKLMWEELGNQILDETVEAFKKGEKNGLISSIHEAPWNPLAGVQSLVEIRSSNTSKGGYVESVQLPLQPSHKPSLTYATLSTSEAYTINASHRNFNCVFCSAAKLVCDTRRSKFNTDQLANEIGTAEPSIGLSMAEVQFLIKCLNSEKVPKAAANIWFWKFYDSFDALGQDFIFSNSSQTSRLTKRAKRVACGFMTPVSGSTNGEETGHCVNVKLSLPKALTDLSQGGQAVIKRVYQDYQHDKDGKICAVDEGTIKFWFALWHANSGVMP